MAEKKCHAIFDHDLSTYRIIISVLREFEFGTSFIDWIKISLYKQKSCFLTVVFTTMYFNLEKGTCQGDPISGYLFICTVEIIFLLIKKIPQ